MNIKKPTAILIVFIILAIGLTACGGNGGSETENMESMEEMDHDNHEHDDEESVVRIPNEGGAAITIVSPTTGSRFAAGDQIIVEVSTENFPLGETQNHWHVYVDGASWGMIMGGNSDYPLSGLEPGEYELSVFMSIESHEEYADGDAITIIIEE